MSHESVQARAIFIDAVENVPPERWRAYLDEACGEDATLRDKVQRLLDAHGAIGSFMDRPAVAPVATIAQPITERPGTQVGRYKLLEKIGEGGFGVVFMAEQGQPVRRKVALKIIKPGMDTREVIARFEAERQTLAIMDHPNIAKVFDAGATDTGRPFFVMELVRGVPITDFCDQNRLTTRERLELFAAVCQAIQHAHQKGIIHRDIKPSNVLVTLRDDRPIPKVIDFGVAKATNARLTEQTLFTRFGQMIGTPLYMSPEQAGITEMDVDTRSDIYSLGVLLYELLTGSTPFDQQRVREAAYDELLRIIREEEPPCPSLRISTLGDTLPSVAAHRKTEPKKLSAVFRGELDWIVMKALEKDRTRRYETANGFASDIQRYLNDEPVEACPPSVVYRFKKFARRNKAAIAATTVVVAALIAGIIGTGWQAKRVADERDRAKTAESNALIQAARADNEAVMAARAAQREKLSAERERMARREAQQHLHDAKMQLVVDAYDETQRPRLLQLLSECESLHDAPPFEWKYWWRQSHRYVHRIDAADTRNISLSPDQSTLVTGGRFSKPQVWDVATGKLLGTLLVPNVDHREEFDEICFSPDGNTIATQSCQLLPPGEDEAGYPSYPKIWTVRVWDRKSLQPRTLLTRTAENNSLDPDGDLAFSADGALLAVSPSCYPSSGEPQEVLLLRVSDGSVVHAIRPHRGLPTRNNIGPYVAMSPDGSLLAIVGYDASRDAFAQLWFTETGELFKEFRTSIKKPFVDVAFTPDGTRLLAVSEQLITWDVKTGRELNRRPTPYVWKYDMAVLSDNADVIAAASENPRELVVRDCATQAEIVRVLAGRHNVNFLRDNVKFTAEGTGLVTGSPDGSVRFWDIASNRLTSNSFVIDGLSSDGFNLFAFSPDGNTIVCCNQRGTVDIWDANSWVRTRVLDYDYLGEAHAVAFSPDGSVLATSGRDRASGRFRIDLRDMATDAVRSLGEHTNMLSSLEFSPDGNRVVSCDRANSLMVWAVKDGRLLWADPLTQPAESNEGVSMRGTYSSTSGSMGKNALAGDLCFLAGDRLFVATPCTVFDINTGSTIRKLPFALRSNNRPTASSPDAPVVAITNPQRPTAYAADNTRTVVPICLVDTNTWKVRTDLNGHLQGVNGMAFSPDGTRLASTSEGFIIVWNVSTGNPVLTLRANPKEREDFAYDSVAFSPKGETLALGGHGQLRIVRVATSEEIQSGCSSPEIASDLAQGDTFRMRQRWQAAIQSYTRHISQFPDDDAGWWGRAKCYLQVGDAERALSDYRRLATLWSKYGASDESQESLRNELRGLCDASGEQETDLQKARAACQLVYDISESTHQEVLRLHTFPLYDLHNSEVQHLESGRFLHLHVAACTDLAEACLRTGDSTSAIRHFCHAVTTLNELGLSWDGFQQIENQALQELSRLLTLEKCASTAEQRSRLNAFSAAMEENGECATLLAVRGRCHVELDNHEQAAADVRRAIEIDRSDISLWLMLLDIEFLRGASTMTTEAIVTEAEAAVNGSGPRMLLFHDAAWSLLLNRGDEYEKLCLKAALRYANSTIYPELFLLARAGALTDAPVLETSQLVNMARRACEGMPKPEYQHTLGLCLLRDAQPDAAIEWFNKSLDQTWKGAPVNWLGLAIAHSAAGRDSPAQQWLRKAQDWFKQHPLALLSELHPHDRIACQLLLREAERRLQQKSSTQDTATEKAL